MPMSLIGKLTPTRSWSAPQRHLTRSGWAPQVRRPNAACIGLSRALLPDPDADFFSPLQG